METCFRTPEEHIASIRQEKFSLAPDGSLINQNSLSGDLQSAIRELSEGLYSRETHFILELIQNAEDNRYEENEEPDLTFTLFSRDPTGTPKAEGALLVINNEAGFRSEDVKALCAIGQTTKTKREGYVGEKGIGFKSVFVVSSQPHIFSAGYQFRFQKEPDPQAELGYIVPYWVSEIPPEIRKHSSKTCIVLPLKAGKREGVAKELETIAPETVLFLSKLQGLTVQIEDQERVKVIRDDTRRPLVQFMTDDRYVDFWLVEQEVSTPPDLREEKREGITTRKVSVALPLTAKVSSKDRVFAFLPTRVNSDFPFLINADFILSTSRETIQFDRPWNRWLRDCIAPAFIEAFESLLDEPKHRARAYSYIPLAGDDQKGFFQPTVEAIHNELSDRAVVWTFWGETLVKPREARLASLKFRKLLSHAHIPTQLQNTPLVHPQIQTYGKQLKAIGVEDMSPEEIIECLKDESWLESQDPQWFIALYEYLSQQSWATQECLRELRLLPLQDGRISNTVEQPVYFPGEDVQEIRQLQAQVSSVLTIAFLNPKLYALLDGNQGVTQWLVDTLGGRDMTPANFCLDLARGLNDHRAEVSVSELVYLTAYIRDEFDELNEDTQEAILEALPVARADGTIIQPRSEWRQRIWWRDHQPESLVMPEAMDPKTGWQVVFPDQENRTHLVVLSDAYLDGCSKKEETAEWQGFLERIGADSSPPPCRKHWLWVGRSHLPDDLPEPAATYLRTRSENSTKDYRFSDWRAPRWLRELAPDARGGAKDRHSRALLAWLEERTARKYQRLDRFDTACYRWHYRRWYEDEVESELGFCLQNAPWFPSTQGPKRPGEVFLDKPELRELFGDALPYALGKPSEKVANWVGLRQTATVDELLRYLKELTSRPADQVDQKVVRKVYTFLSERWGSEIKDQFEEYPLILVSKPQPRWVTAEQTVWLDSSAVVGEAYVYLEAQYPRRFKEFFVEKVGVAEQLDDELYARAWAHFAHRDDFEAEAVEAALERIYPVLLKVAQKVAQKDDPPGWWQEFCADAEVWTQSDCFKAVNQVYVPDDGELKRLFTREGVEFAWRPEKASFAEYQPLYSALGVRSLVEMVETSAEVQQVIEPDGRQPLLTPDAKKAICFYLRNTNRDEYERTKQSGVLEALLRTREQTVGSLTVSYELNRWTTVQIPDSSAHWQEDEHVLYRSDVHSQDQLDVEIPAILARRLAGGRTSNALENFIGRILGASAAKVEGIIHKKNWNLPAEEQEWIDEVLASSLRQAEPEPKPKSEPTTEPETEPEPETEAASPKSKHELGGRPEPRPAPQPRPRPEPKPEPGLKPRPKPEPHRRRPRLRSYVEPGRGGVGGRPLGEGESQEEREAIERAGIEFALEYERQHERIPEELPPNHEGWDIDSYAEDPVAAILDKDHKHRLARRIEVKATKYGWDGWGVGLTSPQHTAAQQHGEEYYLYVVEHALDLSKRILYVFRNPAGRIADYRFDDAWTKIADETYRSNESV